jgi:hypothetical protein
MKAKFIVEVKLPECVSAERMRLYIQTAVRAWCGGMDPQDPIYDLSRKDVRVRHERQDRKASS